MAVVRVAECSGPEYSGCCHHQDLSAASVSGSGTLIDTHPQALVSWNFRIRALPPPRHGTYHLIIKDTAHFFSMVIYGNEACRKPHKIDGSFH